MILLIEFSERELSFRGEESDISAISYMYLLFVVFICRALFFLLLRYLIVALPLHIFV